MRAYATRLVAEVKVSDAKYTHDNQTRKVCPDCGKYLLLVKGKRGEMLVCPDRECGYRRSVTQVTNARCPNCFKKMELRGEGENQMFACVCGYREKLSAFKERRAKTGAGKRDVASYMAKQKPTSPSTPAWPTRWPNGWRTREPLNKSAAALSGSFVPAYRFENLEINQKNIRNPNHD